MNINQYQRLAWEYALPSARTTYYLLPGFVAEVGELCALVAKAIRDDHDIDLEALKKELGDVLWFVAALAWYYDFDLSDVAIANIEKLASRAERGTIGGSGDER